MSEEQKAAQAEDIQKEENQPDASAPQGEGALAPDSSAEGAAAPETADVEVKERPKSEHSIDFKKFFKEILIPLTPPKIVLDCIKIIIPGDTQASDFEEIIDREAEEVKLQEQERELLDVDGAAKRKPKQTFKSLFIMLVNNMGLANEISDVRHAIGMLGVVKVRNAMLGMSLYQHFNPEKTIRFDKIADGAIDQTIKFALEAEEFTNKNGCKTHLAFVGGLLFDLANNIIAKNKKAFSSLQGPLKKPDDFIAELWKHSLAVGYMCHYLAQRSKAKIHLSRYAFVTGLLHDIGKLGLIADNPKVYDGILKKREDNLDPFSQLEEDQFDFPHETITALMLKKLDVFTEIELPIDHHHDHDLLAIRNPDMHRLAALIEIADAIIHNSLGFLGQNTDVDVELMPARTIIKLEKRFVPEALNSALKLNFN